MTSHNISPCSACGRCKLECPRSKFSEFIEMRVAGRQRYHCANAPNLEINGLENYNCPMWAKKEDKDKGCFDESGFEIDYIEQNGETQNDGEENLQALCLSCYAVKTNRLLNAKICLDEDSSSEEVVEKPKKNKKVCLDEDSSEEEELEKTKKNKKVCLNEDSCSEEEVLKKPKKNKKVCFDEDSSSEEVLEKPKKKPGFESSSEEEVLSDEWNKRKNFEPPLENKIEKEPYQKFMSNEIARQKKLEPGLKHAEYLTRAATEWNKHKKIMWNEIQRQKKLEPGLKHAEYLTRAATEWNKRTKLEPLVENKTEKNPYQKFMSNELKRQKKLEPGLKNTEYLSRAATEWNKRKIYEEILNELSIPMLKDLCEYCDIKLSKGSRYDYINKIVEENVIFDEYLVNQILKLKFFDIDDACLRILNIHGIRQILKYLDLFDYDIDTMPIQKIIKKICKKHVDMNQIIEKIDEIDQYKYFNECYEGDVYYSDNKTRQCKKCKEDICEISDNVFYDNEMYDAFRKRIETLHEA